MTFSRKRWLRTTCDLWGTQNTELAIFVNSPTDTAQIKLLKEGGTKAIVWPMFEVSFGKSGDTDFRTPWHQSAQGKKSNERYERQKADYVAAVARGAVVGNHRSKSQTRSHSKPKA